MSRPAATRVTGLDATRGAAMLLVCLSHFGTVYLEPAGHKDFTSLLRLLTYCATPSFLLISGVLLGFLHSTQRARYRDIRRKLVDRALFLLTIAHLLIWACHVPYFPIASAANTVYVTDVIACCVVVGSFAAEVLGPAWRVGAGLTLYAGASLAMLTWIPAVGSTLELLKHLLVGRFEFVEPPPAFSFFFPVLPWLGVYLVASALGSRLAKRSAPALPATLGGVLWALAIGSRSLQGWAARVAHGRWQGAAEFLLWRGQKTPPGPVYLALYLGAGLMITALALWLQQRRPGLLGPFVFLGQNSLFAFVAHYALLLVLLPVRFKLLPVWPAAFAGMVAALFAATWAWQRIGGARLLTVGYPALMAWVDERVGAPRREVAVSAGLVDRAALPLSDSD